MGKKKAKLIFKHNFFEIIEDGDYVNCAITGKEIQLKNLKCILTLLFSEVSTASNFLVSMKYH